MKIGVFDSGLGGLQILQALTKRLPEYSYEYYGDTKHLPYGDREEEEIYELTKFGIEHLFSKDCVIVIIACNTASAETTRRLQREYLPKSPYSDRKILGVIIPTVEYAVASGAEQLLLLGTSRTVASGKYDRELKKLCWKQQIKVPALISIATPELVPLIEAEQIAEATAVASRYIEIWAREVDGVILGCTHYGLMSQKLQQDWGKHMNIISQTEIIPGKVYAYLKNHSEIETRLNRQGKRNIYLTNHSPAYLSFIDDVLGRRAM